MLLAGLVALRQGELDRLKVALVLSADALGEGMYFGL